MKVVSENTTGTIIRNEAAITEDTDSENNPVMIETQIQKYGKNTKMTKITIISH